MRWVRHLTGAHDDDKHQRILDRFGARGYGAYWLLLEYVASRVDSDNSAPTCSARRSEWASRLRTSPAGAASLISSFAEVGLIETEDKADHIVVSIPKLLKYHDDYTRKVRTKAGQTPDKSRTDAGQLSVREVKRSEEKRREVKTFAREPVDNSTPHAIADAAEGLLGAPSASDRPHVKFPAEPTPAKGALDFGNDSHLEWINTASVLGVSQNQIETMTIQALVTATRLTAFAVRSAGE